jgi:hypothetical protein
MIYPSVTVLLIPFAILSLLAIAAAGGWLLGVVSGLAILSIAFGMINPTSTDPGLAVLALGLLALVAVIFLGKCWQQLRERKQAKSEASQFDSPQR